MARLESVPDPVGACVPSSTSSVPVTRVTSRHSALVRVTHWITTLCFLALLVSGVEIVISHPRFYWGETGNDLDAPLFKLPIPSSRALVPTGYGYVLPDQNGWSRYLHFQAAWVAGTDRLAVHNLPLGSRGICGKTCSRVRAIFRGGSSPRRSRTICDSSGQVRQKPGRITCCSGYVLIGDFRSVPVGHLVWPGDVPRLCIGVSGDSHSVRRAAIRAHNSFLRVPVSRALPAGPRGDGLSCRIPEPDASDDHGPRRCRLERT